MLNKKEIEKMIKGKNLNSIESYVLRNLIDENGNVERYPKLYTGFEKDYNELFNAIEKFKVDEFVVEEESTNLIFFIHYLINRDYKVKSLILVEKTISGDEKRKKVLLIKK